MLKSKANYFTSAEVSVITTLSTDQIRNLIRQGKVKAEKLGHNWIIHKSELWKIQRQRQRYSTKEASHGRNKRIAKECR